MTAALRLVVSDAPAHAAPTGRAEGSGVRRLPEGTLPDLTHLAVPVAPPPVPAAARRRRVEALDFEAIVEGYRPRAPAGSGADAYFPTVPGIPILILRPLPEEEPRVSPEGARLAVLLLGSLAGAALGALL